MALFEKHGEKNRPEIDFFFNHHLSQKKMGVGIVFFFLKFSVYIGIPPKLWPAGLKGTIEWCFSRPASGENVNPALTSILQVSSLGTGGYPPVMFQNPLR